jgi:predicted PurR-regulated permease PerM
MAKALSDFFLTLASMSVIGGLIWLLYCVIRKKNRKYPVIVIICGVVLAVIGGVFNEVAENPSIGMAKALSDFFFTLATMSVIVGLIWLLYCVIRKKSPKYPVIAISCGIVLAGIGGAFEEFAKNTSTTGTGGKAEIEKSKVVQPQTKQLEKTSELVEKQPSQIEEKKEEWRRIAAWQGVADKTTEPFTIKGKMARIKWTMQTTGEIGGSFVITLYRPEKEWLEDVIVNTSSEKKGEVRSDISYIYKKGTFYLVIEATFVKWSVIVEELP